MILVGKSLTTASVNVDIRMTLLKGWLYCFLWYTSILAGYAALFCPLLPVLFISNKLYRCATDILFTFWQYYPTALLEFLCKCEIQITGDPILTGETSLLIMNHRTRTDWNFLWPTVYHCVMGKRRCCHSTKFVLKDVIRHIPGPGWVMQLACFVYIKRCWLLDKNIIQKYVNYVSDLSYKHSLVLFPEGTDFTSTTKKSSNSFAEKNNLQKYEYVLHPRTTGFTFLCHQLMEKNALDAIYDVTLLYPDLVPQSENTLLNGEFPKEVKVHLTRYPSSILPNNETGLKKFLEKRWLEKERIIKEYNVTGQFLHGQILRNTNHWELYFAFIFWSCLPYITLYYFIFISWFRYVVILNTLFLLVLNFISDGFQSFEICFYNLKKNAFELKGIELNRS